ncbi:hypothetical protein [Cryobacterium sp. Y11]|uniref:hypothetical protein n=1 Tax=Cryobacterium sp. Y11 TaxID=2045016 RepID=UPI000CE47126|nr:hypothetical protein [Cryobacterium sp. Y11]
MRIRSLIPAAFIVITALTAGPVMAAGAAPLAANAPLGLVALGQSGSFFDSTISPGETVSFEVERVNPNDVAVDANTYIGTVSTIVNGGFGAGDSSVTVTGASTWVDYPTAALTLAAQARDTASFTVTVPADAAPGQYVSSIVLESTTADATGGQISLSQLVRTAIAISIRVPGELVPAFSLAQATLGVVADRTVVSIETSNTGNQHLKLSGPATITDSTGLLLTTNDVVMGSFYAQTATTVSITLDRQLSPGDYVLDITLTDPATGVSATQTSVPLSVAAPDLLGELTRPITEFFDAPPFVTPLVILLVLAGFLGLAIVGFFLLARHRRRRRQASAAVPLTVSPPVPEPAAAPTTDDPRHPKSTV